MKTCVTNTAVEVDPPKNNKTFNENLYRGVGVLSLGAPFLISLLNVSLYLWLLQCNHITPSTQTIWIKIISIKVWYKPNNNITYYKDAETKQGSSDSYLASTWSIAKCNKIKWHFLSPGDYDTVQHIILINKSGPQENFIFREKKTSMRSIILPWSTLILRWRTPLNFSSGWGYLGKIDYSHQQQRSLCPSSLTGMKGATQ